MGNRYSHATYSIIHHARCEAEALGVANGLSTKHLLLALLYDSQSKAVRALSSLGVSVERIRLEVKAESQLQDETPLPVVPDEAAQEAVKRIWDDACTEGILPDREGLRAYFQARRRLNFEGTHPARQAVTSAYDRMRSLGDSECVEPHHLLLALMREKEGVASRVFTRLGLSVAVVTEALKGM